MAHHRTRMARGERGVVPQKIGTCGELIRYFRRQAGMQQLELAARAGIPQSTISKLENNKRRYARPSTIHAVVRALGLDEKRAARLMALRSTSLEGVAS